MSPFHEMQWYVTYIRIKDLSIISGTLNGCQVNESAIKDIRGERKMEDIMVVLYVMMSPLASTGFCFILHVILKRCWRTTLDMVVWISNVVATLNWNVICVFWQVGWQEAMTVFATMLVNKMGCRKWIKVECIREYWFCF